MSGKCLEKPCSGCPIQQAPEPFRQEAASAVDTVLADRTPKEFSKTLLRPIHELITQALSEDDEDMHKPYSHTHQIVGQTIFYVLDGDCESRSEFQ
jgi:hypothetical protein